MLTDETNSSTAAATNPAAKAQSSGEIQQFVAYLLRVIPLATDFNSPADVEELKRVLQENPAATESIRRFLTDAQCAVFFIRVLQQGKGRSRIDKDPLTSTHRLSRRRTRGCRGNGDGAV